MLTAMAFAADVRPVYDGTATTQTMLGAYTFSNMKTVTLENGEKIANDTNVEVRVTFDDDGAVLGTLKTTSENAATNIAAGDEFRQDFEAYNDMTQKVIISRIVVDFTDETDTTEDGTHEVWVQVAGTLTKIASVGSAGLTVVGDVAGTTIGGITQANLVDKAATESISGAWTFGTMPNLTNGVSGTFTNSIGETLVISNGVVRAGTGIH